MGSFKFGLGEQCPSADDIHFRYLVVMSELMEVVRGIRTKSRAANRRVCYRIVGSLMGIWEGPGKEGECAGSPLFVCRKMAVMD